MPKRIRGVDKIEEEGKEASLTIRLLLVGTILPFAFVLSGIAGTSEHMGRGS